MQASAIQAGSRLHRCTTHGELRCLLQCTVGALAALCQPWLACMAVLLSRLSFIACASNWACLGRVQSKILKLSRKLLRAEPDLANTAKCHA